MININSKIPIIGIYKITSPSNKVYIGQSINIKTRKNHYKFDQNKSQPKIYNSLKKYGFESHIFEIIEECFLEQLNERETYWKIYYLEQVNNDWTKVLFCQLHDEGGGPRSDEFKLKLSKIKKGVKQTPKHILNRSKPINQYNLKGEFINSFTSQKQASEYLNIPKCGIGLVCNKKQQTTQGFVFRFKNDGLEDDFKLLPKKGKPIIQYSRKGNFIKEWDSIIEASKYYEIDPSGINSCCRTKQKTAYGYIWKYKE